MFSIRHMLGWIREAGRPDKENVMETPRHLAPIARTLALLVILSLSSLVVGESGELLRTGSFVGLAPEGITRDPTDGTFWVPSFIDGVVRHFDAELNFLGEFVTPFAGSDGSTGIAYYPPNDSLLLVEPQTFQLLEVDKIGIPIPGGIDLTLQPLPVVNPLGQPVLRGMAFHPNGNFGQGSLYVVESVGALVYEFDLFGNILRSFVHPDDPDGYPGLGSGAPTGGIDLVLDLAGDLVGIDLVGETLGERVVHRLDVDGNPTGLDVPLTGAAATNVGGIVRATYVPASGSPVAAIYGTNESSASLFIIDGALPPIAELLDVGCQAQDDDILIEWVTAQTYDTVKLFRNGALIQTLPGSATSFLDEGLADDVYRYEVVAEQGSLATKPLACTDVIGVGQVLAAADLPGVYFPIDITEDASQFLWITDVDNTVWSYDKDFNFVSTFQGPFTGVDDELTGIAYRASTNTLFLVNAYDSTLAEVDLTGSPVAAPVALQIPVPDPDNPPWIGSLLFDPNGDGGNGSWIALELEEALVYHLRMDGTIIGSFVHPEQAMDPLPTDLFVGHYMLGLSAVPEIGTGFQQIDIGAGALFDRRMTRFLRVDASDGTTTGFQLPVDGMLARRNVRYWAIHNSTYAGAPVAFGVALRAND
ncbi:MAG: hypothetical protein KDC38_11845, partial [Planctomycetes bacterium]|nr:hypothetical protein [Planctomycetota bacterium]